MINLATLYQTGIVAGKAKKVFVPRNTQAAFDLTVKAMALGIPAAYMVMGNYYEDGTIVEQDITAAWAFWQKAADMGEPYSQVRIARSLLTNQEAPEKLLWINPKIGLQMLECAFAQGNGSAAYELGLQYEIVIKDKAKALFYYHEGVKFGSKDSAVALRIEFEKVDGLVPGIDTARSERYEVFSDALDFNPILRFPNLDKVLPLPPAKLPQWNGKPEDLLDAAKPVVLPAAAPTVTPGAKLSGRANIPQGWVLPRYPTLPEDEAMGNDEARPQYESTAARYSGYWLAELQTGPSESSFNQTQHPQRYARGEPFEDLRSSLGRNDGRIMWHYLGSPVQLPKSVQLAQVRRGIWREVASIPAKQHCNGAEQCSTSGIWQAMLPAEHPLAKLIDGRQSWVVEGQPFPDPQQDWLLELAAAELHWTLMEAEG